MSIHGCDISGWQASHVDFTGDDFVYVKATQGLVKVNANHDAQVAEARSLGLVVGHYHFPNWGDPVAEARAFWAGAQAQAGDFLVLDIETSDQTPWPPDPVGWCVAFEDEVHRLSGAWCLDYAGPNVRSQFNWTALAVRGGGLIDPEYNPVGPGPAAPWADLAMWQNADTDASGGDSDVFYGDRAQLVKYGVPGSIVVVPVSTPTPPPAPAPAPAPVPANGPTLWIVDPGNTMGYIAAQVHVSLGALEAANPGINYDLIFPGQKLRLPAGAQWPSNQAPAPAPAPPARVTQCIVSPGDTMGAIAAQFGVSLDALIAANPQVSDPNLIYPGQVLNLP